MIEQQLSQLEDRMNTLREYKEKILRERLSYPLDPQSRKILENIENGLLIFRKEIDTDISNVTSDLLNIGIGIEIDGQKRVSLGNVPMHSYNVNSGTDVFTADGGGHNLQNGDILHFATDNTLAVPLDTITDYYVINASSPTFKVSLTKGGAAVDITVDPVGTQYYGTFITY